MYLVLLVCSFFTYAATKTTAADCDECYKHAYGSMKEQMNPVPLVRWKEKKTRIVTIKFLVLPI